MRLTSLEKFQHQVLPVVSIFLTRNYKSTVSIKGRSIVTLLNCHKTWTGVDLTCVQDILYDLCTPGYTGKLEMSDELRLSQQQPQLESKAKTIIFAVTSDLDWKLLDAKQKRKMWEAQHITTCNNSNLEGLSGKFGPTSQILNGA